MHLLYKKYKNYIQMKKSIFSIICLLFIVSSYAQEIGNFMGMQRMVSPEIGESQVTFRISAPYADDVDLSVSWMSGSTINMRKDDQGVWSVSLPTPDPEIYTYNFIVDGLSVSDPSNTFMQRDGNRYFSVILIPGELTENYYEANERGNLEQVWYNSSTLGIERRMFVYTPYGYADSKEDYPVLYLLHGAGGDEDAWSTMGRACQILDNLIEKGLAKPMICVMPNGNPTQIAAQTLMIDEKQTSSNGGGMGGSSYPKSIVEDIVPYIESYYQVDARPRSRALAGLSMGGGHTITTSLMYPEVFDYICPLSAAYGFGRSAEDAEAQKKEDEKKFKALDDAGLKLYFLACGNTDFLFEGSNSIDKMLTELDIDHTYYVTDGGHTWSNWRKYLNTFAPLLFK